VRRWDGQGWTDEVRPIPDWLRTLRLSPGPSWIPAPRRPVPSSAGHRRRSSTTAATASRRLWITSGLLVVLSGMFVVFLGSAEDDDADRIGDRAFVRAANARCARTSAALEGEEDGADGARVERITIAWEDTVSDLRELPVASADARSVDAWFRAWDRWVALGHDYADAVDAGDSADAEVILTESAAPKSAISRFALVNDMNRCVFR
jgi:hypothetical protein